MENCIAQIEQYDNDGNGIQNAQYGNGELNQLAQAHVRNHKAKNADDGNVTVVLHFFLEHYVEVTGNRTSNANTSSKAGEENNQR